MTETAPRIVAAEGFDPFCNLALEDYLFRTAAPGMRTLYLWVNDPAVVIGRYQNPWLECRVDEMEHSGVALARRQSGGGAVYHDRGNLCATFMGPRSGFKRQENIAQVVAALGDLGIDAETNERNDILVGGRKVSGSAYRESADRCFHHLTLLVDADLEALSAYLKPTARISRAKGVASVRSPVANLREWARGLTVDLAAGALARRYAPEAAIERAASFSEEARAAIETTAKHWKSWDWRFGASPEFAVRLEAGPGGRSLELEVRGGKVARAEEGGAETGKLVGSLFSPREIAAALRAEADERAAAGDAEGAANAAAYAEAALQL